MKAFARVSVPMDAEMLSGYFERLVDRFFKILPLWEEHEPSLPTYIKSMKAELTGCRELIEGIHKNPSFLSLLFILQYFESHPDCDVAAVKREVFRAISLCNELKKWYGCAEEEVEP